MSSSTNSRDMIHCRPILAVCVFSMVVVILTGTFALLRSCVHVRCHSHLYCDCCPGGCLGYLLQVSRYMYHVSRWTVFLQNARGVAVAKGLRKGLPRGSFEEGLWVKQCKETMATTEAQRDQPPCGRGSNRKQNMPAEEVFTKTVKHMSSGATVHAAQASRKRSRQINQCHQTNKRMNNKAQVFSCSEYLIS